MTITAGKTTADNEMADPVATVRTGVRSGGAARFGMLRLAG